MKNLLVGFFCGLTILTACSMGSKRIDYDKFAKRSDAQSIWQKCSGEAIKYLKIPAIDKYKFACKKICTGYTKKNKCKKKGTKFKKRSLKIALDSGDVLISKSMLLNLIGN